MRPSARAEHPARTAPETTVRQDGGPMRTETAAAAARDVPHRFLEGSLGGPRRVRSSIGCGPAVR
ncbi:hypothetical protein GCM10010389_09620 [Streptomyces echinoruber]|uniref:Uncharacterized protein n=1 Tax=Streptomyces echinoruber TaxID=68898 RepID=A0A918QY76_9ACTN|nr:hypothetical protein GCM10010389_09620 [Streptomyces echinoruber]